MYCPRCSQQQVAEAAFCTRCGFQLNVVKALLTTDGSVTLVPAINLPATSPTPTRKESRFGVKVMFFSAMSLPLFLALMVLAHSPFPLVFPALAILVGLTCVLYARIFREDVVPSKGLASPEMVIAFPPLHPLHSVTAGAIGELGAIRTSTAEMIQPPSVTEDATTPLRHGKRIQQ